MLHSSHHHLAAALRRWLPLTLTLIALVMTGATASRRVALAAQDTSFKVYLPATLIQTPSSFGLNMTNLASAALITDVVGLGTNWVRSNSLLWSDVQPTERSAYQWSAAPVQRLEQEMINASRNNLQLIVIIRGSPRWATAPYKADCAPINPAKYGQFAAFVAAAVERYSKPPYNVAFWEIGNEPDGFLFPSNSAYGCWGIMSDPYYGGRAYGAMLNVVYPAIKAVAPQVNVLNGGLLLDQPYNPSTGNGRMARFLEGMFVAGAAPSFDILSFHSYSYYDGTADGTRGATDWKVAYLRNLMQAYNVPQKPMIDTEAALLCTTVTPACQQSQADALARYYVRAINDGLIGHMWYIYDSDSFNNTALVDPSNIAIQRPAYLAYQHAAALLGGARLLGPLSGQPAGVEGYRFTGNPHAVTVFWSNSAQVAVIPVDPGATVSCTDRDGAPIICANIAGQVTITAQTGPTYVVEQ
jgi:hypothetical protein